MTLPLNLVQYHMVVHNSTSTTAFLRRRFPEGRVPRRRRLVLAAGRACPSRGFNFKFSGVNLCWRGIFWGPPPVRIPTIKPGGSWQIHPRNLIVCSYLVDSIIRTLQSNIDFHAYTPTGGSSRFFWFEAFRWCWKVLRDETWWSRQIAPEKTSFDVCVLEHTETLQLWV